MKKLEIVERKREYYYSGPDWIRNIWKRRESLDHFIKSNKERLSAAGAVVKIGRDYFVDTEVFPVVACEVLGIKTQEPRHTSQLTDAKEQKMSS